MAIRRPLSLGSGWVEVSLYTVYAKLGQEHLTAGRYYETILICCAGFDVLMNSLPDRLKLHHYDRLTLDQQGVLGYIEESDRLTAGQLLGKPRIANILHQRLDRALKWFNDARNDVIHPIRKQQILHPDGTSSYSLSLKRGAIVPQRVSEDVAKKFFRLFCHIIDLAGGKSPRKAEKIGRVSSLSRA